MRRTKTLALLPLLGLVSFSSLMKAQTLPAYEAPTLSAANAITPTDKGKFYVYNVNADKFLTRTTKGGGGVDYPWGTRACIATYVGDDQNPYVFTLSKDPNSEGFAFQSTGYKRNSDNAKNGIATGYLRIDPTAGASFGKVYTDHSSITYWDLAPSEAGYTLKDQTNKKYLIPANSDELAYTLVEETLNENGYWRFYSEASIQLYLLRKTLFPELEKVKAALIVKPDETLNQTFTNVVNLYNNEATTPLLIYTQITILQNALDRSNYVAYKEVTDEYTISKDFQEAWNTDRKSEQTISSLPAGVYRLSIQAFNSDPTGQNSYLYANSGGLETKANINSRYLIGITEFPTNIDQAKAHFSAGLYSTTLTFIQPVAGEVKIGIFANATNKRWTCFQNLQLFRIGDAPDAATPEQIAILTALKETAADRVSKTMNSTILSNLQTALTEATNILNAAEQKAEEVATAFDNLNAVLSAANLSIVKCANLKKAHTNLSAAWTLLKENNPGETDLNNSAEAALKAVDNAYTAETIAGTDTDPIALIAAYRTAEDALRAKTIAKVVDTEKVINGTFDTNTNGWTTNGTWNTNGLEFYDKTFNTSQELTGLSSEETYTLSLQGYYREDNNPSLTAYREGTQAMNAYLYAKSTSKEWKLPLLSVYAESGAAGTGTGQERFPYWPAEGQANFSNGRYKNVLLNITPDTDGKLTIGIKYETLVRNSWIYVDNFVLSRDCHFDPSTGEASGTIVKGDLIASETATNLLKDNYSFNASAAVADKLVSYVRNFSATGINQMSNDGWQTICLPFKATSIKFGDKELTPGTSFWLYKADAATNKFVAATEIEANQLYLIAMPNDPTIYAPEINISGDVIFSGNGVMKTEITPVTIGSTYQLTADYQSSNDGYGITDFPSESASVFKKNQNNGAFWSYALNKNNTSNAPAYFGIFGDLTSLRNGITTTDKAKIIHISTRNGAIEVHAEISDFLTIYTTDGQLVKRIRVPEGDSQIPMTTGKYIINGKIIIINP